ncbi:MAG: S-adenosyl-L-homocysteine hydrolase [Candidatus Hecatellales archaeon B24]|nr:MAG: S-adenosyl-L-homocysteine hydrolase [Candidatus Hecatellales archaeon B24]
MAEGFKVKDLSLAEDGRKTVEWAESRMPVLMKLRKEFSKKKPLEGWRIGACLHVTKETAVLVRTLMAGGAEVALCASNPLSTQDEVAAFLAEEGVNVYAWRGETTEEYYRCVEDVLAYRPRITVDDGADLVTTVHTRHRKLIRHIVGGTEETTTGVIRLRAMARDGKLGYPIIAVNDAFTKYLFDNRYGTGQSTIDGVLRATSVLLAGKRLVVAGYGWCGRGIALRARGMGANVIVVETSPLKALEALMDGFQVFSMGEAASQGDIFITATGNIDVIRREHLEKMKDGAILANAGHFNVEINLKDLEKLAASKRTMRPNIEEYKLKDGRRLYLLAEGRLVNLAAAEGHPPEVMMMSFANQALSIVYLAREGGSLKPQVYRVPEEIDRRVAELALEAYNVKLEKLTVKQRKYLESWELGTI